MIRLGSGEFHIGDCFDVMATLPDASVDMVLADLPYGTTACAWDSVLPLDRLWFDYRRILKPFGAVILTGSQPFSSALVMSNPEWFKYEWVWLKNKATGHVHAKNKPMKKHEQVLVFSPGTTVHASQSLSRMCYNPQGLSELPDGMMRVRSDKGGHDAVMSARKSHKPTARTHEGYPISLIDFPIDGGNPNNKHFHPTQKPVDLFEYLIRTYSNPGDTVLDNTAGSGTTAIAAERSGRRWICIERDPAYYYAAVARVCGEVP